jgi:hypothetical protein
MSNRKAEAAARELKDEKESFASEDAEAASE